MSRTQNRKAKKAVSKAPHEETLARFFKPGNPYLNQLLLPEESDMVVAIPDEFSSTTHIARIVTQIPLTSTDGFNDNESSFIVRPSLESNIVRTSSDESFTLVTSPNFIQSAGGRLIAPGYFDESSDLEGFPSEYPNISEIRSTPGSGCSIVGPYCWSYHPFMGGKTEAVPNQVLTGLDYQTLGTHIGTNVPTLNVTFQKRDDAQSINFFYKYVSGLNSSNFVKNTYAFDISQVPNNSSYLVEYDFPNDTAYKWIYEWGFENLDTGVVVIQDARLWSQRPQGNHYFHTRSHDIGDDATVLSALKTVGTTGRVVAMSAWLQYNGSMLANGRVTFAPINDGSNPFIGWKPSPTMARLPNSYSGPLTKGAYYWYKPVSREDMMFRNITDIGDDLPYLAAYLTSSDAEAQNLTLRVTTVVEIRCTNPVFGPRPSPVNPALRDEAMAIIAYLPQCMENDLHLAKLTEFVKKALSKVGGAARFVSPFLQGAQPLAAPLASAGPEGAVLASLLTGSARIADLLSKLH